MSGGAEGILPPGLFQMVAFLCQPHLQNFREYINLLRMEEAGKLLVNTSFSVTVFVLKNTARQRIPAWLSAAYFTYPFS